MLDPSFKLHGMTLGTLDALDLEKAKKRLENSISVAVLCIPLSGFQPKLYWMNTDLEKS